MELAQAETGGGYGGGDSGEGEEEGGEAALGAAPPSSSAALLLSSPSARDSGAERDGSAAAAEGGDAEPTPWDSRMDAEQAVRRRRPRFHGDLETDVPAWRAHAQWNYRRMYAHTQRNRTTEVPPIRDDMTQTVLFVAGMKTNASGIAAVEFDLSDAVTTLAVTADAYTKLGAMGIGDLTFAVTQPLVIEAKIPPQVIAGDVILMPIVTTTAFPRLLKGMGLRISVTANVTSPLSAAAPETVSGLAVSDAATWRAEEATGLLTTDVQHTRESTRSYLAIVADSGAAAHGETVTADVTLQAVVTGGSQHAGETVVTRQHVRIMPRGFPVETQGKGALHLDRPDSMALELPADTVAGSLELQVEVHVSPLPDLSDTCSQMIDSWFGRSDFANTLFGAFPTLMAVKYFEAHAVDAANVALREEVESARASVLSTIPVMTRLEGREGGFRTSNGDDSDLELTTSGLLFFLAVKPIAEMPADVVTRTVEWLVAQRDGKGNFNLKSASGSVDDKYMMKASTYAACDRARPDAMRARVLHALTQAGADYEGLQVDLAALEAQVSADGFEDTFIMAKAALALHYGGRESAARKLAQRLAKMQGDDGAFLVPPPQEPEVPSSFGVDSEQLECTMEVVGMAMQAWLQHASEAKNPFAANLESATRWLVDERAGMWTRHSSYAARYTARDVMPALLAYEAYQLDQARASNVKVTAAVKDSSDAAAETAVLSIDAPTLSASRDGVLRFDGQQLVANLKAGHSYTIELTKSRNGDATEGIGAHTPLPWTGEAKWQSLMPVAPSENHIQLATALSSDAAAEGDIVGVTVTLDAGSYGSTDMVVAVVGLPAGLVVQHERLRQLQALRAIAAYQINDGTEVKLFVDSLPKGRKTVLSFDTVATFPGTFLAHASRAYAAHAVAGKHWAPPLRVTVSPAATIA
eukprot:TRINITY_DN73_c0_g1_i1.p1 TRINITY_DN73_c0_g1~~TRINITY_DN73_c0_g1_i1.p1  ORF type:complete len:925 (+),score=318.03 TRINITY_DN73_c0_g1_i1:195-2969(+)